MTTSPLNLWLTSRSVYEAGTGHCQRDRYLSYHAGPHGYGWQRRAQSVPQVTGGKFADILAEIHTQVKATDQVPPDGWVYGVIQDGIEKYTNVVNERGLSNILSPEDLAIRTNEQILLLEGLVWCWVRVGLPALLERKRILLVEAEYVTVLGCTCGLGDRIGAVTDHDARECRGFGWQTRGDLICEDRVQPRKYSYEEFKTPSTLTMDAEAAWYYRVQLIAGILGAEDALGATIDEVNLHNLLKGPRKAEYNPETRKYDGAKYQQSNLVYAYRRPGNPPFLPEDWKPKYNYVDDTGRNRKLTKDYDRTGLWEFTEWQGTGALSLMDYWTRWIGQTALAEHYKLVGPIYRNQDSLDQFTRQLIGEEERWQTILWRLHEYAQQEGQTWGDPGFMALLDTLVPQTRGDACHSYYGEQCPHLWTCDKKQGWEVPELIGYIPRRPHHVPELEQAIARGLIAPEAGLAEEFEE